MAEYTTTEESLNRFLTTITAELESLKHFMKLYAPTLAPGFNAFDCLYPDENRLSAVIAMLLDPNGGHGQGAVFLKLFLDMLKERIQVQDNLEKISRMDISKLQEACTGAGLEIATTLIADSQRRIDILLHFDTDASNGFGLAIENKPWACDQPQQIIAYDDFLTKKYSSKSSNNSLDAYNYMLIYLSSNGQPPGKDSVCKFCRIEMEQSGRFAIMSYSHLREWCLLCAEKCQAPRLRYFLEDFALYIRDKFEGGIPMIEKDLIIKNALKPENIGAAVAIGFSWAEISKMLIEELANQVLIQIGLSTSEWEVIVDFDISGKGGFEIKKNSWEKLYYKFEFSEKNTLGFTYGIVSALGVDRRNSLSDTLDSLDKCLGIGDRSNWWPWSKKFEAPYQNWNECDLPWVGINGNDRHTVTRVAKALQDLDRFARKAIDEFKES